MPTNKPDDHRAGLQPDDDEHIIIRAARGDRRAQHEVYLRYASLVHSVVGRYRLSSYDHDDVCQTVWLAALQSLGQVREPDAFPGWITAIARHDALRRLTVSRRERPIADEHLLDDGRQPEMGPDEHVLRLERRQLARASLAVLTSRQRELIALLHADPPTRYRDVSNRLQIPLGSIGPTRSRCLQKLQESDALRSLMAG